MHANFYPTFYMPSVHAYPCAFCLALSHAPLSLTVCFTGMYARCLSLHELRKLFVWHGLMRRSRYFAIYFTKGGCNAGGVYVLVYIWRSLCSMHFTRVHVEECMQLFFFFLLFLFSCTSVWDFRYLVFTHVAYIWRCL